MDPLDESEKLLRIALMAKEIGADVFVERVRVYLNEVDVTKGGPPAPTEGETLQDYGERVGIPGLPGDHVFYPAEEGSPDAQGSWVQE